MGRSKVVREKLARKTSDAIAQPADGMTYIQSLPIRPEVLSPRYFSYDVFEILLMRFRDSAFAIAYLGYKKTASANILYAL